MCANYAPPPPRALREFFQAREPLSTSPASPVSAAAETGWTADAYPASVAPFLTGATGATGAAAMTARLGHFGLLPGWARDDKLMRQTYNARSETVAEKPSFRSAWRRRQFCLVPMTAFYEPCYEGGAAPVRWRIARRDGAPFAVAGLWESAWRTPAAPLPRARARAGTRPDAHPGLFDEPAEPAPPAAPDAAAAPAPVQVWSFTLLTVNADGHPLMGRFHAPGDEKRSIVALPPEDWAAWLAADEAIARAMLRPVSPQDFDAQPAPRPARR